jgi:cytoskeleton protein RodZ
VADEQAIQAGAPPPTSVGAALTTAREDRQLSIEQLSAELRIEPQHLRALEQDRFDAIGAPVFAKGYLRQYGQRLGLDYGDLLVRYREQVEDNEVQVIPRRPIRIREDRPVGIWLAALLAAVFVATIVVLWALDIGPFAGRFLPVEQIENAPPPPSQPSGGVSAPAVPVPAPIVPAADPESVPPPPAPGPSPALEPASAPEPIAAPAAAPALAVPTPSPVSGGSVRSSTGEFAGTNADAAGDSAAPTSMGESGSGFGSGSALDAAMLRVVLEFNDECWVEASDASGQRRYYGLGEAGARAEFDAVPPVQLLLGNADAVSVFVDGAVYPVPDSARQGNLARFFLGSVE